MNASRMTLRRLPARERGVTLIEMMVVMGIGLVLTLAIFLVLSASEGRKRTTTSVNDTAQAGGYGMYVLDKMLRSAGSGFGQSGTYAYGCTLFATKGTTQILPAAAGALPAPFAAVNTGTAGLFRLAPVLIAPGQTTPNVSGAASDVLVVMGGAAGFGEYPVTFRGLPTAGSANALDLPNTLSFRGDDLVMLAEEFNPNCMIQQVQSGFAGGTANALPLAGTFAAGTIGSSALVSYSMSGTVMNMGNTANGNPPTLLLVGVGDNNTLFSYNLLQTDVDASGNPAQMPLADGVFELHALYGVDPTNSGVVTWVSPSSSGYDLATLMAGTPAAVGLLQSIKAVRVGIITRTSLRERDLVSPGALTLFSDLTDSAGNALTYTRNLTTAEQNFRYRTIESTIPIRNNLN